MVAATVALEKRDRAVAVEKRDRAVAVKKGERAVRSIFLAGG
ncbi:MAG: hypothetical protein QOI30_1985 [Mycobacterium sp.]|jgi:hypothetical protein|nr:hypothetical protein [Mycobacterium sp.]MDT7768977.1 hypothetical protein [Mycobacterium sp.]